ncbi:MAG: hypothetical protein ACTHMS_15915 [Jatrophihabitans sp.]|uniref:hypothetical protein n=1 Tax=Jatrophihabitans sp. TaxID=1932789 RepID=UPI003F80FC39
MTTVSRPPDRLPRAGAPADRGREIRLGLLGVLGLLVLVIGVPVALAVFVGYPLPRSAPSREWLTQSLSATLVVKVIACLVWAVWAHFVVCLLAEWRAVRRGRLPHSVALGGSSQALARRLVAAALLLGGAATASFPHGGGASQPVRPPAATVAVAPATAAPVAEHRATPAAPTAALKYYVVSPPEGRHHDCLWDIAERTLNDPLRWKEIYALNHDRVQVDGARLTDADLIRPGWELRLPADATGPGVHDAHTAARHAAPATASDASAQRATSGTSAVGGASGATAATTRGAGGAGATATTTTTATTGTAVGGVVQATTHAAADLGGLDPRLLGGGLMAAGLLLAVGRRRGPLAPTDEAADALALIADLGRARRLDHALRALAAARRVQGRVLPQPVVAWVSDERVDLHLAGGDAGDPPAPWAVGESGAWSAALDDTDRVVVAADVAAPFPALVAVGHDDGHDLFVDLEQAPGLVAVAGDLDRARDLVTAMGVQLATSAWSDGARVTLVGFADGRDIASLDPAITAVDHLAPILADLEREHERAARLREQLGLDGVLAGRQLRRDAGWRPHLLVLSGPPTPDEVERLAAVVGTGRSQHAVLVVGDTRPARWRFVVGADGRLDLGVLGATATAHRLGRAGLATVRELVDDAVAARTDTTRSLTGTPTPVAPAGRADAAPRAVPDTGPAWASVQLLGPVRVTAPGPVEPRRVPLLTELVVAVALHPDGVHDAVLRASLWPRGVGDDVFAATMREAVAWLEYGGRRGLEQVDGRWRLTDDVRVDRDVFAALATGGDGELDRLRRAVELIRGEAFSATPPGRYAWLAFARAGRETRLAATVAVRRAAHLLLAQQRADSADQAEAVLRRGLLLVPTSEPLWRDLLVLVGDRGPEPAAAVADELYQTLDAHRVRAEPETDALVAHLAPDGARSA